MATTVENATESQWSLVATGDKVVTLTAWFHDVRFALTDDGDPPDFTKEGHTARQRENVSLRLPTDARLWVRGRGKVAVTVDDPA